MIIITDNINRTALKEINIYAETKSVKILSIDENLMEEIVARNNCKAIAIEDKNLAEAIYKNFGVNVNEQN